MLLASAAALILPLAAQTGAPKPKRINKAIELLEQGQPVYYAGGRGGFEEGKKMAQTYADYINYEMEHGVFDLTELREFMRGLVAGGPTKSGHRTPAVIVTLPVLGLDAPSMLANSWVVQQTLATGVHGILLCHARSAEAVKVFVESVRYAFAERVAGLGEGWRGSGSQGYAAQMWGIPANEYLKKADPWPLNKNGEILLGLKIEDKIALGNAEKTTKVPGVGFAEWGPGDMGWSLVGLVERPDRPRGQSGERQPQQFPPVMLQARARVLAATKAAKVFFLNAVTESDVVEQIKEGVMVCSGGPAAAEKGRKFSNRPLPY
ncbi:MAG: aldolase/citrate lyase family protein [Bryobacteraceae bacterium]